MGLSRKKLSVVAVLKTNDERRIPLVSVHKRLPNFV